MLVELAVQLLVDRGHLQTSAQKPIRNGTLAGQDVVLSVVPFLLNKKAFADALGINDEMWRHGHSW